MGTSRGRWRRVLPAVAAVLLLTVSGVASAADGQVGGGKGHSGANGLGEEKGRGWHHGHEHEPYSDASLPAPTGVPAHVKASKSGLTVTVTAAGVNEGCRWDFGDGTERSGNPATHTYSAPGTFPVKGTCTVSFRLPVTVGASAALPGGPLLAATPFAGLLAQAAPTPAVDYTADGLAVTVTASGVGDGCVWDFGDGATGSGAEATHAYAAAGTYDVTADCPVVLALDAAAGVGTAAADPAEGEVGLLPWFLAAAALGAGGVVAVRRVRAR